MALMEPGDGTLNASDAGRIHLAILGDDAQAEKVETLLARVGLPSVTLSASDLAEGRLTQLPGFGVLVLNEGSWRALRTARRGLREEFGAVHLPILVLLDSATDPLALGDDLDRVDAWVSGHASDAELAARILQLARTSTPSSPGPAPSPTGEAERAPGLALEPRFLEFLVHDLRTPLNVMRLSLRLLAKAGKKDDPETTDDLEMIEQNVKKIETMLSTLCDYLRLFDPTAPTHRLEVSPSWLLEECLDGRSSREGRVILEEASPDPGRVTLDLALARLALTHALANAVGASNGTPVRVRLKGEDGLCRIEIAVQQPPPPTVKSGTLSTEFERFLSNPRERRGLDLAIVAKICERFAGSARLEVQEGGGSLLVLDWPAHRP